MRVVLSLWIMLVAVTILHLFFVGEGISPVQLLELSVQDRFILFEIRLPRTLLAIIIGAGLAISGVALQALFRNPLAEPGLIGIASCSALGAVSAMVLASLFSVTLLSWHLYGFGFAFGLAGLMFIYQLSNRSGRTDVSLMLLAGVAISLIAGAITQLLMSVAEAQTLQGVTFWLFGSLANPSWESVIWLGIMFIAVMLMLLKLATVMDLLQLGESQAFHLGYNTKMVAWLILLGVALLVSSSVAVAGLIGFVGLVVPHLIRSIVGQNHQRLLPFSALAGASLVLLADYVAQVMFYPIEIPIGILMALVGAPFFLWMLIQQRRRLIA